MKLNLLGGLLVGLLSNLIFLGVYFSGLLRTDSGGRLLFLVSAAHAVVLIWVLSRHRQNALPDAVPFSKLFGAGLFLSFVAGVFTGMGSYTFTTLIDPTHLDWVVEKSIEYVKTLGLPEAELQKEIAEMPSRVSPVTYAIQGLTGICITGFFLSLVIAALLRIRALQLVNRQGAAPA